MGVFDSLPLVGSSSGDYENDYNAFQLPTAVNRNTSTLPGRLLEITPYKDNDGIDAGANLLQTLHDVHIEGGKNKSDSHAFEIWFDRGEFRFKLYAANPRAEERFKRRVQNVYTNSEVIALKDSPAVPKLKEGMYVAGSRLEERRHTFLPIRHHEGEGFPHNDPYSDILGEMSSLDDSVVVLQVVFKPARPDWTENGPDGRSVFDVAEELRETKVQSLKDPWAWNPLQELDEREPSKKDKKAAQLVEQQHGKQGFHINIRMFAASPSQLEAQERARGVAELFTKMYNHEVGQWFLSRPTEAKKGQIIPLIEDVIERRCHDHKMILSLNELAGISHIPNTEIEVPQIDWKTTKSGSPVAAKAQKDKPNEVEGTGPAGRHALPKNGKRPLPEGTEETGSDETVATAHTEDAAETVEATDGGAGPIDDSAGGTVASPDETSQPASAMDSSESSPASTPGETSTPNRPPDPHPNTDDDIAGDDTTGQSTLPKEIQDVTVDDGQETLDGKHKCPRCKEKMTFIKGRNETAFRCSGCEYSLSPEEQLKLREGYENTADSSTGSTTSTSESPSEAVEPDTDANRVGDECQSESVREAASSTATPDNEQPWPSQRSSEGHDDQEDSTDYQSDTDTTAGLGGVSWLPAEKPDTPHEVTDADQLLAATPPDGVDTDVVLYREFVDLWLVQHADELYHVKDAAAVYDLTDTLLGLAVDDTRDDAIRTGIMYRYQSGSFDPDAPRWKNIASQSRDCFEWYEDLRAKVDRDGGDLPAKSEQPESGREESEPYGADHEAEKVDPDTDSESDDPERYEDTPVICPNCERCSSWVEHEVWEKLTCERCGHMPPQELRTAIPKLVETDRVGSSESEAEGEPADDSTENNSSADSDLLF